MTIDGARRRGLFFEDKKEDDEKKNHHSERQNKNDPNRTMRNINYNDKTDKTDG